MEIYLVTLFFFSALGVLAVLYTLHFRHRALAMGQEHLLSALSRTITGDEEVRAEEEELRQGLSQLEARLKRASYVIISLLTAVLAACLLLIATSTLPQLNLALSGVFIFLIALFVSVALLRDIPRNISQQLDGESPAPE
ncbi:MAG: hypothetical protein JW854_02230 [Actinobacteria bacterium]|nr:hypothetical protein [Actinomycetota bacterium]